jgi:hypothetical protein
MREDDLIRSVVTLWREIVKPDATDAECWSLDLALRREFGGRDCCVKKKTCAERERAPKR